MSTMCKTDKGTLIANSFGNNWYSDENCPKGLIVGVYGKYNLCSVVYSEEKQKFVIRVNNHLNQGELEIEYV